MATFSCKTKQRNKEKNIGNFCTRFRYEQKVLAFTRSARNVRKISLSLGEVIYPRRILLP
jgi:hypothetical protein